MDYLKISKATDLTDAKNRKLYRILEIFPGFLSWATLVILLFFSAIKPVWVAYFIIACDVYWLLLVIYLGINLFAAYVSMKKNLKIDWRSQCENLPSNKNNLTWQDIIHLVIFPTYDESLEVIRPSFQGLINDGYPTDKMIMVLAIEERAGQAAKERARAIEQEFGNKFKHFLITVHPDNMPSELKGKGANQAWAARQVKQEIIDKFNYDYNKILVSIFDIDTVVMPGYFYCLTHNF